MSIFRRVSFLGFALVSLVVLAACGGNGGDGDGSGEEFELPPPGEYRFEVTGTVEIEFSALEVSAGPVTLQESETGEVSGGLTIQLGEDGKLTIKDKEGVDLVVGNLEGGPVNLSQNEDKQSTGTIGNDGMKIELNVLAELGDGVTTTHAQPILLEGDGDPFSDEGATLTSVDAEPVRFMPVEGYGELGMASYFIFAAFLEDPDDDEQETEFTDAEGDEYECDKGEDAKVEDASVDILSVSVIKQMGGVRVRVKLLESPSVSEEWFSFSVQVQIGQEGGFQVGSFEVHDKKPNSGRIDAAGEVIPGSEGDVTAGLEFVRVFFPGLVLKPGDTVTARSFHLEKEGDTVHCDVTDAFPLSELE